MIFWMKILLRSELEKRTIKTNLLNIKFFLFNLFLAVYYVLSLQYSKSQNSSEATIKSLFSLNSKSIIWRTGRGSWHNQQINDICITSPQIVRSVKKRSLQLNCLIVSNTTIICDCFWTIIDTNMLKLHFHVFRLCHW